MAHELVRICDTILAMEADENGNMVYHDNYEGYKALRSWLWEQGFDTRFYSLGFVDRDDNATLLKVYPAKNSVFFDIRRSIQNGQGVVIDTLVAIVRFLFSNEPRSEKFLAMVVLNYATNGEHDEQRCCISDLTKDYTVMKHFLSTHGWHRKKHPVAHYSKEFETVGGFKEEFRPFIHEILVNQLNYKIPSPTQAPQ